MPGLTGDTDVWETWGTYQLSCVYTETRWRLSGLRDDAERNSANDAVRTPTV